MSKRVRDTKAGESISAYVVTNRRGELLATVQAHFSGAGVCTVNVYDNEAGFQSSRAGGYGYDKFTAALGGMRIAGHTLTNHCEGSRKPPKGAPLFPVGYKPAKGWSLANYAIRVRDNADAPWRQLTIDESRATKWLDHPQETRESLSDEYGERTNVAKLRAMRERGDMVTGYSSCYKKAGLDYLRARGLRVHKAI
jgi:hypothetical protein